MDLRNETPSISALEKYHHLDTIRKIQKRWGTDFISQYIPRPVWHSGAPIPPVNQRQDGPSTTPDETVVHWPPVVMKALQKLSEDRATWDNVDRMRAVFEEAVNKRGDGISKSQPLSTDDVEMVKLLLNQSPDRRVPISQRPDDDPATVCHSSDATLLQGSMKHEALPPGYHSVHGYFHGPYTMAPIRIAGRPAPICGYITNSADHEQCGIVLPEKKSLCAHLLQHHGTRVATWKVEGPNSRSDLYRSEARILDKYYEPGGGMDNTRYKEASHAEQREEVRRRFREGAQMTWPNLDGAPVLQSVPIAATGAGVPHISNTSPVTMASLVPRIGFSTAQPTPHIISSPVVGAARAAPSFSPITPSPVTNTALAAPTGAIIVHNGKGRAICPIYTPQARTPTIEPGFASAQSMARSTMSLGSRKRAQDTPVEDVTRRKAIKRQEQLVKGKELEYELWREKRKLEDMAEEEPNEVAVKPERSPTPLARRFNHQVVVKAIGAGTRDEPCVLVTDHENIEDVKMEDDAKPWNV